MQTLKKLIVDLNAKDAAILRIMHEVLDLPKSTIIRWAIRHYALHGPIAKGTMGEDAKRALLEAVGQVTTGLFIQESAHHANDNGGAKQIDRPRKKRSSK